MLNMNKMLKLCEIVTSQINVTLGTMAFNTEERTTLDSGEWD
jgi:hypothetical protein